ncbi:CheY-like chemotaxis protein [Algoriphagus sp. 4150]|uniref:response regulator n=1 Tax=Algoriphagus sp. 4150 TaxID=2817756 RepID=UPI0028592980|nr:response regulator [Algoriphagus sp. 4150]MDR7127892.1 CheY-like chemotaxis protein [Algoriphagus sp. 4150]
MEFNLSEILIIDDDEVVKIVETRHLRKMDFFKPIFWFKNGLEGLMFIKSRPIQDHDRKQSLILLDIEMPVMDCWAFLWEFEQLDADIRSFYRIIVRTSSDNPDDRERILEIDSVREFLYKPLNPGLILEVFEKHGFV